MNATAAALFSLHWNTYKKIVAADHMHHRLFREAVGQVLMEAGQQTKTDLLDLGCGDAAEMLAPVRNANTGSYTGFDLSDQVLELTRLNIEPLVPVYTLQAGDMLELISKTTDVFHVIHSAFAIHHLSDADKMALIQQCHAHLHPGGKLIIVDVFRETGETRDSYLIRYLQMISTQWSNLGNGEQELVSEHIRNFDHPAVYNDFINWCTDAGFVVNKTITNDTLHRMLVLNRP